ncbi:hypothetical protein [Curtobacterium sp. P97]|uniref:hypothetical protein n=1 Tax=Curtobacterium sp. P97 TaxID=2939562 RepID=UPI00203D2E8D|nr:hypothetical protein [Curtobacterium sp. P97]MCM3522712.1 hypothetical protein [Curtobacterium sp. P97]
MSDGIKVDYAEIDRLTTGITALNAFAGPLVPKVGALSVDGNLLASAILSPGTALAAEGAVMNASAQLSVTIVSTEALVIITASFSKVYEAAEAGLALTVAGLQVAAAATWATTTDVAETVALVTGTVVYGTIALGALATEAVRSGVALDVLGIVTVSFSEAALTALRTDGDLTQRTAVFTLAAARSFNRNFSAALPWMSPDIVAMEQAWLGDLRTTNTYDGLLSTLIGDGRQFGLFEDGVPRFIDGVLSDSQVDDRRQRALVDGIRETGQQFTTDGAGNIIPTDVSSLLASSGQIDRMGQEDFANVRVFKTVDENGVTRFTVQIPSTQSWNPEAGDTPNDLTSDVIAMRHGDQTALSQAVIEALRKAGVKDEPVMLTGFSLGGITAGAVAAGDSGYNIQQVVTAGSPIGAMDIPSDVHVTALESTADPIAALDGTPNPRDWTTLRGDPPLKANEHDAPTVATAHDANRYAVMASGDPSVNDDPAITQFLGGNGKTTTVTDYQVQRRSE